MFVLFQRNLIANLVYAHSGEQAAQTRPDRPTSRLAQVGPTKGGVHPLV
jgi:hypothetical protein